MESIPDSVQIWDFKHANTSRSLILLGISALLGLGIAGYGLFTAKGTTVKVVPPEDVALVNQRPILRSDFVTQAETLNGVPFAQTTPEQRQKTLNDMIREELFVQRGLELDFAASDPDVRQALVAAVERQVQADVTAQRPTDEQLMLVYERDKDKYSSEGRMTLRSFVLPITASRNADQALTQAEQAAEGLRDTLKKGGQLDENSGKYGLVDTKKTNGEEFYFSAKIHLGEALFNVARSLKEGSVSEPIALADGVYILVMQMNSVPVPQSFEKARDRVLQDYTRANQAKLLQSNEKYVRSQADILIAPELQK